MERNDAAGDASNIAENAPIAGGSNGRLAGRHAGEASRIADVAADRSVPPRDRGETIEDILLELNATSRVPVPPPTETLPALEDIDKDERRTESIASSGCGADPLEEDDLENSGAGLQPLTSEMEDDEFIVADEASTDEVVVQEDGTKKETEEDRAPLPTAPESNDAQEEKECSETAVSSERAGNSVVTEIAEVNKLSRADQSSAGSAGTGSVEESKMPSVAEKVGDSASEVPGTPRRTGRQRNAPQRFVDSAKKRSPERGYNGHQKPTAQEIAMPSSTVDQSSHAEAVPNGDDSLVGQANKVSPRKQHPTKAQRKLMVENEVPELPNPATPTKCTAKLAFEGSSVPPEAPDNIQPEIFSDDDVTLLERKMKASPRGKASPKGKPSPRSKPSAKVQSQLLLEGQISALPKRGTPRKRATKVALEQIPSGAPTNGVQPDVLPSGDVLLEGQLAASPRRGTTRKRAPKMALEQTPRGTPTNSAQPDIPSTSDVPPIVQARASPRPKQRAISPKKVSLGKRVAKPTVEQVSLLEIASIDVQAEVFSDEDAPLTKRRSKPSPKGKTPTKAKKRPASREASSASLQQGTPEHTAKLTPGAVVPYVPQGSSIQPDLLSDDDVPLAVRKTKASPKKQTVGVRRQLALEEQPQAPSSQATTRKRLVKVDADPEASSLPRKELKRGGKRQRTTADNVADEKLGTAKMKRTAAKSATASEKTEQIGLPHELPHEHNEEPMEKLDVVQEEQNTLEADGSLLQQEHRTESSFSFSRPRCISGGLRRQDPWTRDSSPSLTAEEFVSSDRLLRETVCLGLHGREATAGPAFLTIEVPSLVPGPRRCWGPKSARRRPTVVFGGCDPYQMYVNVHGTRVLLQQWSRAANITPSVRLTDLFAGFSE